jgi:hypothetical protein
MGGWVITNHTEARNNPYTLTPLTSIRHGTSHSCLTHVTLHAAILPLWLIHTKHCPPPLNPLCFVNCAQRHEGVWRRGDTAPLFLACALAVLCRRLREPHSRYGHYGQEKNLFPLQELETQFLGLPNPTPAHVGNACGLSGSAVNSPVYTASNGRSSEQQNTRKDAVMA